MSQRQTLALKKEDILFNFIYQIGIMLEDHPEKIVDPGNHLQLMDLNPIFCFQLKMLNGPSQVFALSVIWVIFIVIFWSYIDRVPYFI